REPVHLVDDENLEAIAHRREREGFDDDLADVVDAGVGGGVDLEDVEIAAFADLDTHLAGVTRRPRRAVDAVERLGQQPRRCRLADAARPREDERLGEPPRRERVLQRLDDAALTHDVLESRGAIAARKRLMGGSHRRWTDGKFQATRPTAARTTCGTGQDRLSAAAFRP